MSEKTGSLKSDALGLLGAATMGVVVLSPAMTLYGGFGPTFLNAGKAAPLSLVWALIITLPTAISYALLARDYPLSGSASSWINLATPKPVATWACWMVFMYYFLNFIIEPVTMGVFAGDILGPLGLTSKVVTYIIGAVLCCVWAAWIVYRGISFSSKGALGFLLVEIIVVFSLCATILWFSPLSATTHFGLEGFTLAGSPTGTSGVFRAMVFATLAYCGFDVVSTLAEETKMARRLIPQATLLSLFLYAGFIIWGMWCLTYSGDTDHLKQVSESGVMPISDVASRFWGKGSILVSLTAISACLGLAIAVAVGASRILFAMGRDGTAPKFFSVLDPKHSVPTNALHVIFGVGFLGSILSGVIVGPYNAYVWWGTTISFFALLTYITVHVANLILNRSRAFTSVGGFLGFFVIPIIGIAADVFLLVRTFFMELWGQDWATGKSVVCFDVGVTLIVAMLVAIQYRSKKA